MKYINIKRNIYGIHYKNCNDTLGLLYFRETASPKAQGTEAAVDNIIQVVIVVVVNGLE